MKFLRQAWGAGSGSKGIGHRGREEPSSFRTIGGHTATGESREERDVRGFPGETSALCFSMSFDLI